MTDNSTPKFVATPEWDQEHIEFFGMGDTPEEAGRKLAAQPILNYSQVNELPGDARIEARVYTTGTPQEAGLCEAGEESDFTWGLIEHVDTYYIQLEQVES